MVQQRIAEIAALLLIGDGMVGMLQPERHTRLWRRGPTPYRAAMEPFVRHRWLSQVLGAMETGVGLCWASRQRLP